MERKLRKNEQTDKRINAKLTKAQGDNTRKITVEKPDNTKVLLADRGDSNRKTNQITDKFKLNFNEKRKTFDQTKPKNVDFSSNISGADKDVPTKKPLDKRIIATKQSVDLEEWRNVREKYTLKSKNNLILSSTLVKRDEKENVKNEKTANRSNKNLSNVETTKRKEKPNESSNESGKSDKKTNKKPDTESYRKPIIKTITSKNDARIYKSVSFVDQKRQAPIPLQINVPSDAPKKHRSRKLQINSSKPKIKLEDNVSVKEKPITIRKKINKRKQTRKKRETLSPDGKRTISPATEVAKWAPTCLNHHTKPYYEAWVNTTLAAFSKNSKKDKLFFEKHFIKSFQKAMEERPVSPDLIYDKINDERYTGRIRVRQRK